MELKRFESRMIDDVVALYKETILTINRKDYSAEQVETWADNRQTVEEWVYRLQQSLTYVALMGEKIVGFGNLTKEGLIDLLYVHKDHQAEGIGSKIMEQLEINARLHNIVRLTTEASITAKPFFLSQAFHVQQEQTKVITGVKFINYKMTKTI